MVSVLILCGTLTTWAWIAAWRHIRKTTLQEVWLWQAVSCGAVFGAALLSASGSDEARWVLMRWFAVVALFCPNVALLGAKRPQHRAWHLVVATLWVILLLPSIELLWAASGRAFSPGSVRGSFLWVLIVLEILNRVGSGSALIGWAMAAAQISLLGDWLPGWPWKLDSSAFLVACLALVVYHWTCYLTSVPSARSADLSQCWRSFRRRFGTLWALRVWLGINAACQSAGWPVVLGWSGFRNEKGECADPQSVLPQRDYQALTQVVANLLRRFEAPQLVDALVKHQTRAVP